MKAGVRDINTHPARKINFIHPDIHPGMAGAMGDLAWINVARHITHGYSSTVAAGNEEMRMILTDAFAQCERIAGGTA